MAPIVRYLVGHAKKRRDEGLYAGRVTPTGYYPAFKDSAAAVDPHLATLMQNLADAQFALDSYLLQRTEGKEE